MSDPIVLDNVTVRIRDRVILDGVSFAVPKGSVFALLGRNGAGKTTAFRCLLGQRRPDEGRALLFGQDAWTHRAPRWRDSVSCRRNQTFRPT